MMLKTMNEVELLEIIFEYGYELGKRDANEGIHIEFNETKKHFADKVREYQRMAMMSSQRT